MATPLAVALAEAAIYGGVAEEVVRLLTGVPANTGSAEHSGRGKVAEATSVVPPKENALWDDEKVPFVGSRARLT